MTTYFLDSCALVKRYHQEIGTEKIDEIFRTGNKIMISDISIIEIFSAMAKKVRNREIDEIKFNNFIKLFCKEIEASLFKIIEINNFHKINSVKLLIKHALTKELRTLDTIQLSFGSEILKQEKEVVFVSADNNLIKIAKEEKLRTINPVT